MSSEQGAELRVSPASGATRQKSYAGRLSAKASRLLVKPFHYRPAAPGNGAVSPRGEEAAAPARSLQQLEREAWERGIAEGRAQARREFEAALCSERDAALKLVQDFALERERYFRAIEQEVIRLALSIARRILHRESQLDPLALSGMVRVALDKVSASTRVKLRVHPAQLNSWQSYFARHKELRVCPELEVDNALQEHQCRLETELGNTEISLDAHLQEIERGLFDLLHHKSAAASVSAATVESN